VGLEKDQTSYLLGHQGLHHLGERVVNYGQTRSHHSLVVQSISVLHVHPKDTRPTSQAIEKFLCLRLKRWPVKPMASIETRPEQNDSAVRQM
jgi:hypothetical protein